MTYAEALQALHRRGVELGVRRKFDLGHMHSLAQALGSPQQKFRSVLIAGTNGKGSTAATLAAICATAGLRTGLYTSPHLARVNERININGSPIADNAFAELFARVEQASAHLVASRGLPHEPSYFETLTAIAFCAFADAQVDIAILEVGLGGRLDATNIVRPLLSVITDIDYDHTEWLGATLPEIATEKAGILRDHGVLVTLPQHPQVNQTIGEQAMARNVTAVNAADYIPVRGENPTLRNNYPLRVLGSTISINSPLWGQHQQRNLALAIATAIELRNRFGYKITAADIEHGIRDTQWPARLELLHASQSRPAILLDVAHNAAGAWTLRAAISALDQETPRPKTLLFACLADKPIAQMAQVLFTCFNRAGDCIVLTRPNSPRAADPAQIAQAAATLGIPTQTVEPASAALEAAFALTPPDGLLVCAGSVYLVGELRPLLL